MGSTSIAVSQSESSRPGLQSGAELAIIVPTFNEAANVGQLVDRLESCLAGIEWELIVVDDDSPDGTSARVRELARDNPRLRCLQRIGRRGLSSACIEGMLATAAPYLAVMDGDLQHDEALLPRMLDVLQGGQTDIVVGSRYVEGGGDAGLNAARAGMSQFATRVSRPLIPADLQDPMSGFFMLRREIFDATVRDLSGIGFKILLDIFATSREQLRFQELPYEFRSREAGESKLDTQALWDYGMLLLDKMFGRWIPARFVSFMLVGGVGVFVHMAVLSLSLQVIGNTFLFSQAAATLVAMTTNFIMNNLITYRDLRLRGWGLLRGWLSFVLACSIGAIANVGVAQYLFEQQTAWALAGLAGILVGAVWNYVITLVYTWRGAAR
ncbi:MAG: glycosyltransferase family 2 protein [Gammaproteobacteria bacterium]|nr:glycosyltransferase family 2 protein [Gammaproteobacteria bacterium]